MSDHPGDSSVQRSAELVTTQMLSERLGVTLTKRRFNQGNGQWFEVDAASDDPPILCEIWAHQGAPKSAQKAKVMVDAMKLTYARSIAQTSSNDDARLILVFTDERAAAHFRGTSWMAGALTEAGIETLVIELPATIRLQIEEAQKRQYR